MRVLLWLYIALLVTFWAMSLIDPDSSETPAEIAFDVVRTVILLIGVVAYALRLNVPRMIAAWRFVAPALVIALVAELVLVWPELMIRDPELSPTEHYVVVGVALGAVVLLLTPAVVVNFRFARARHLDAVR